jgi:hypothetical protein
MTTDRGDIIAGGRMSHASDLSLRHWDEGWLRDDARQAFVIPQLSALVKQMLPSLLVDIGAKTGQLIDSLLEANLDLLKNTRVIAIDSDADATRFMRNRFRNRPVEVIQATLEKWTPPSRMSYDTSRALYILSYTALELSDDGLRATFAYAAKGGVLIVFLPDVLQDVLESGKLAEFLTKGVANLRKMDKFTSKEYPFIARRLEAWLPWAVERGLRLQRVESYRSPDSHSHFLFQFNAT